MNIIIKKALFEIYAKKIINSFKESSEIYQLEYTYWLKNYEFFQKCISYGCNSEIIIIFAEALLNSEVSTIYEDEANDLLKKQLDIHEYLNHAKIKRG